MRAIFSVAAYDIKNCQDSTSHHSNLTLGLRFCTILWCVRWISHFGNRRTSFHWNAMFCSFIIGTFSNGTIRTKSIFPIIRKDFDAFLSLLDSATEQRGAFLWNTNPLVSLLHLDFFTIVGLGWIHLYTQYSLCKLGTAEMYQICICFKIVFT